MRVVSMSMSDSTKKRDSWRLASPSPYLGRMCMVEATGKFVAVENLLLNTPDSQLPELMDTIAAFDDWHEEEFGFISGQSYQDTITVIDCSDSEELWMSEFLEVVLAYSRRVLELTSPRSKAFLADLEEAICNLERVEAKGKKASPS